MQKMIFYLKYFFKIHTISKSFPISELVHLFKLSNNFFKILLINFIKLSQSLTINVK